MTLSRLSQGPGLLLAWLPLALLTGCATVQSESSLPTTSPASTASPSLVPPPSGPLPEVDFPEVQRHRLSNGLAVWIVEQHEVPLATVRLTLDAGAAAEPAAQAGLASLTAALLDEGTRRRSALQIAEELELLGASFGTGAGLEAAMVNLSVLSRHLPAALDLFADVITSPTFAQKELERVRRERLTALLATQDQPAVLANQQFARRLYGREHPYGRQVEGTTTSLEALTRGDLQRFYDTFYRPDNATLLVVGDVTPQTLLPLLEKSLGSWKEGATRRPSYPARPPALEATRIFLIDKPGAAQSEIRVGHPGIARDDDDYFPLLVLNAILGGDFGSRINMNLREEKGYTYGARSNFAARREPGPFLAQAAVQTPATKESVVEFIRELQEIRSSRPVSEEELHAARSGLVRREPLGLETQGQILSRLEELAVYELPAGYFDEFSDRIQAVSRADVERVAREHLHPERLAIVVVGDRAVVEPRLRELPYPLEVISLESSTPSPR